MSSFASHNIFDDFEKISSIYQITKPGTSKIYCINHDEKQTASEKNFFDVKQKQYLSNDDIKIEENPIVINDKLDTYNFVIITEYSLYNSIISSNFLEWKESIGFNVKIVNISDDEIESQSGEDLPQKIRNFLRSYHQIWGIEYVLIIGNHATIPMRYCYPDPNNHRFNIFDWTSGEVPTDYYYADLSGDDSDSWDLDGDGYFGEYGQDTPDFCAEVYVGRIPTNSISRITYTLDKFVVFEQDTGDWKKNALHAAAFFYFTNEDHSGNPAMDGAILSHYIENDIMNNWTIKHFSEQQGLEKSVYDWPALTESSFINEWRNGKYAIVNWQGHGWTNRVARKVWSWDDGDGVPEGPEISWPDFINVYSNLDDDYPSVVTAESCYVGCPEPSPDGNLGIDLLTDPSMGASIGVVASARSPYGSFDWPNNPGGSDSIIYEFNHLIINESEKIGEALYNSKFFCNENYGWDHFAEYLDMYTFNLFGDPSLVLEGIFNENNPPVITDIYGPNEGKPGIEYTFCINISDPDEDNIFVFWDWGDGINSGWVGPFESGIEICENHSWDLKGLYVIQVRLKDEEGLISPTMSLEISIPRTRTTNFSFDLGLFNHFSRLFLRLKSLIQLLNY
jgi:hypothetical protein